MYSNAGFLDNGESVSADQRVYGRHRRDASKTTIFLVCAPLVLEKIGSEISPRGCAILRVLRVMVGIDPSRLPEHPSWPCFVREE